MLLGEARLALIGTPWSPLLSEPIKTALLPPPATFRDESGHTRSIDALLIAWLTKATSQAPLATTSLDLRLWQMLLRSETLGMLDVVPPHPPLVSNHDALTLEVWTEIELASLHALSHAGPAAKTRTDEAADWIVANLQPDNATNHPWAVHLFLKRAFEQDMPEHRLYAESLLHNCVVSLGRPDRFSALILLDAGRSLLAGN